MDRIWKIGLSLLLAALCISAGAAGDRPTRAERRAAVIHNKGLDAVRAGDWEAAATLMSDAYQLDPHFLPTRFWMGRIKFEQKNWAGAEEDFKAVLEAKSNSLETHYWLGRVLEATDRPDEAREHYLIVLNAGLKDEDGRDAVARLKALSGEVAVAQAPSGAAEQPTPEETTEEGPKPPGGTPGEPGVTEPAGGVKPEQVLKPTEAGPKGETETATGPKEKPGETAAPTETKETTESVEAQQPLPGLEEEPTEKPAEGEEKPAEEEKPPAKAATGPQVPPPPAVEKPPAKAATGPQVPPPPPVEKPTPGGEPEGPAPKLDTTAAGAALLAKLRQQQPARILILGDTFTAAPGVPNAPQGGYAALFADMLKARFADPNLQVRPQGLNNATSAQGLEALRAGLAGPKPDLVVLHFGAYDQAGNVPVEAFQNTLRQMAAAVARPLREAGQGALILATPLVDGPANGPYVQAVKEVAQEVGAVAADFEAAVKGQGRDHRGMFPFGQHPHEYAHTAAARELYRAFQKVVGEPQTLGLALEWPLQYAPLGGDTSLPVRVSNKGPNAAEGKLKVLIDGGTMEKPFTVQPNQEETVDVTLKLPVELPNGRAMQVRLVAEAETKDAAATESRWASLAPVLPCPKIKGFVEFDENGGWAADLPRYTLGAGNVATGQVDNPADCSGAFSIAQDDEGVCLFLEVKDDKHQPTGSNILAFNDCVELLFDLRPEEQRGQPYNTPQVFLLFAQLPADQNGEAAIVPLDTQPPGVGDVQVFFTPTDDGYRLQIAFPRTFLEGAAGGEIDGFGFDLAIDDADAPGQFPRQAQLIWSGRADNFVNPRNFGEVNLKQEKDEKQVRVTVW